MKPLKTAGSRAGRRTEYFGAYFSSINELLKGLDTGAISAVVDCFLTARENKNHIFHRKRGSAATASHFAQDLGEVGRKAVCPGFKTRSLTDNISLISAVGNDYGYDKIFHRSDERTLRRRRCPCGHFRERQQPECPRRREAR